MGNEFDKQHKAQELKDMIKNRKKDESIEEVLVVYCQRHGISVDDCRIYYDQLVKAGEINKK